MIKSLKRFVCIFTSTMMFTSILQLSNVRAETNGSEIPANYKVSISPTPQYVKQNEGGFEITPEVALVSSKETDPYAMKAVKETLKSAGITNITEKNADDPLESNQVTVWVGGPSEIQGTNEMLKSLNADSPENLSSEGYVLAIGKANGFRCIVLAGKDKTGTFYAAQTLRQVIKNNGGNIWVPCLEVRDYPAMAYRGTIEGFYGTPWSHENRLSQIEFYGKMKMNTYIYAPKDDPYHREKWQEAYPADKLAQLKELVDKSKENHVDFNFAISPGNTIRFSSEEDFQKLVSKAQAMYDLGVRTFSILLDDINPNLRDDKDIEMFGKDANPNAAAQSYLLNRFQHEFIETHTGCNPLETVPTEYCGINHSSYLDRMAVLTDSKVVFMWTGVDVCSAKITSEQAKAIKEIMKHDVLIWYNYPVNDYCRNQILMGPTLGLDSDLSDNGIVGIVSNPMNEAEASKIPVFTIGDYNWNPKAYNAENSWINAIKDFAPDTTDSMYTFCDSARSSILTNEESTSIKPYIDEFWANYEKGDTAAIKSTAKYLINEFEKVQHAPGILRSSLGNSGFINETDKYLTKLESLGSAGAAAVNMLAGLADKDIQTAWKYRAQMGKAYEKAKSINLVIGSKVLQPFITKALAEYDKTVNTGKINTFSSMETYSDYSQDNMTDNNVNTFYWTNRQAAAGDYFGIDLGKITDIYSIHILMGRDLNATDYMRNAVVEYSADNLAWTTLTEPLSVKDIAVNNIAVKARYVRLRCTADYGPWWVQVREFTVGTTPLEIPEAFSSFDTYWNYTADRMTDKDVNTFYWTNSQGTAGDYFGVDLGSIKDVKTLNILMGSPWGDNDYMGNGIVEYSLDNNTWTAITGVLNQKEISLSSLSISARYIRYRCTEDYGDKWVKVREFSVNSKAGDITISGAPDGENGYGVLNILDKNIDTSYRAVSAPAEGDKLTFDFPSSRHVEKITIFQDPASISNAVIEVRSGNDVTEAGKLSQGYNSFILGKDIDQITIKWQSNGVIPVIYEMIPEYE